MTVEFKLVDKPTVQQERRAALLGVAQALVKAIEDGTVSGMVCVAIRPDQSFGLYQSADMKVYEVLGLLERVKHDILHDVEITTFP